MQKKSVAVIDVGSSKIEAVVGERGINKTFIIKARRVFNYDGFADGEFFDVDSVRRIMVSASNFILDSEKNVDLIYVGVPGAFTSVSVKESQISFSKKKKITESDVDLLFDSAFALKSSDQTLKNRSAVVYELDDYRRLAYPVGAVSEVLKGKLSFITCSNYFIDVIKPAVLSTSVKDVDFIASSLCEAMYLIDAETRDRIAMLIDVGFISSTFSLIQGDGILYQESFDFGGGYITADLTEKFELEYNDAEELKRKVNLCKVSKDCVDLISVKEGGYFNSEEVKSCIKNSLDTLCEKISDAINKTGYIIPEYVPIYITGGGIAFLRGAKEHVSSRLGAFVDVIAPKVPLMDNPSEASVLSLLNLVFEQKGLV